MILGYHRSAVQAAALELSGGSQSEDSAALAAAFEGAPSTIDVGHAGTSFRFLTAYLATQPERQLLTGSERMQQRPIGDLVAALRELGAKIDYVGEEGYPPLLIGAPSDHFGQNPSVTMPAETSSQFISALLLLAPYLPQGIQLTLSGNIVSKSYIELTRSVMRDFGVESQFENQQITVSSGGYVLPEHYQIEADWSAAGYFYSLVAVAPALEIELEGLRLDSAQGDAALVALYAKLGVETTATDTGISIKKQAAFTLPPFLEFDFINCPDSAQTVAVTCAILGVSGLFSGLETLSIKETDRIAALKKELKKVGVSFVKLPPHFSANTGKQYFTLEGKAEFSNDENLVIETYADHRMAMAFAPLAVLGTVFIEAPEVVRKSYPNFWKDLTLLGVSSTKGDTAR